MPKPASEDWRKGDQSNISQQVLSSSQVAFQSLAFFVALEASWRILGVPFDKARHSF